MQIVCKKSLFPSIDIAQCNISQPLNRERNISKKRSGYRLTQQGSKGKHV